MNKKISSDEFYAKTGRVHLEKKLKGRLIWIHVSSIGEYNAARLIIGKLSETYHASVFMTYFNSDVKQKAEKEPFVARHHFLPFENHKAYNKMFSFVHPEALFIFETEIWPVLLTNAAENHVPVFQISALIPEKALKTYTKWKCLFRNAIKAYSFVAAQTPEDADRFMRLGVSPEKVFFAGNLKYDITLEDMTIKEARRQFFFDDDAYVITLGSIHSGEDLLILNHLTELLNSNLRIAFIIAPRTLKQTAAISSFLKEKRIRFYMRSGVSHKINLEYPFVYILDSIGELCGHYAASDLAVIGGSFINHGGHNILEPIYYNVKTVIGPHYQNFSNMVDFFSEYVDIIEMKRLTAYVKKHYYETVDENGFNKTASVREDNGKKLLSQKKGVGDMIIQKLKADGELKG